MTFKKILVLAPHTDDGEFGCGGAIAKHIAEGAEVFYAAFSLCQDSLPAGLPANTLEIEVKNATSKLGIPSSNLFIFDFKVRYFAQHRQEILEELVKLRTKIQPDLVYLPCTTDIHQDHAVICIEGTRAFKHSSILGYEMPWNNFSFTSSCFIQLSEANVEKKIEAINEYKSQTHRAYSSADSIFSLTTVRGLQCGAQYAEAFEAIRLIIK